MRFTSIAMMIILSIWSGGCSQHAENKVQQQVPKTSLVHGTPSKQGAGEVGMVAVVKKQVLTGYESAPIGKAIEGYHFFTKKEWSESRNSKGTFYIDVTGWLDASTLDLDSIKEGVAARGVQIKFVIYENGSLSVVMVSKVEAKTDGKIYADPMEDSKAKQVLDRIYANKKMAF